MWIKNLDDIKEFIKEDKNWHDVQILENALYVDGILKHNQNQVQVDSTKENIIKPIWTLKTPTEPGWYWKWNVGECRREATIVYIRFYCGRLCIINWAIPTKDIYWSGPIPVPILEGD